MQKFQIMENRIKIVIKEKGYTVKGLAEKMGMTRENLFHIIANPSSSTLEKLSEALDVPVWQFFASREEILDSASSPSTVCPYCGKPLSIEIK